MVEERLLDAVAAAAEEEGGGAADPARPGTQLRVYEYRCWDGGRGPRAGGREAVIQMRLRTRLWNDLVAAWREHQAARRALLAELAPEVGAAEARALAALPALAAEALRRQRARQAAERLAAGPAWEDWGLVFARPDGRPLHGSSVTHRFQALLARAGLPRMRFHDLRHGAASLLLAQGVHPRVVMEVLGHSQIGQTMNTYAHVAPALGREAAARMDAALQGAAGCYTGCYTGRGGGAGGHQGLGGGGAEGPPVG